MNDFSRRKLLKATAVAGAGAVVAQGVTTAEAHGASAVNEPPKHSKCPPAKLTGRIVRPDNAGYTEARLGWDQLFSHYPLVIVFAQNTQDVVNALTWSRQNDVAVRVRSGRHSLEGWSNVDNGLVIDISELKSVHIDSAARIATVGAGLSQLEAVTTLAEQNFAVTTGTEGTVGLSGATLGGGFGFLTRWLGMACDSLIGAEIVVAEGDECAKVVKVDPHNNQDLLWALRGAGNGNFGIVTSLTYRVAPLKSVTYVQATWTGIGDLRRIFDTYQRTAPYFDDRLGTQLEIHRNQIFLFGVLAEGTPAEAKKLLDPLLSIDSPQVAVQVGNWGDVYAGFQIPTADEPANWKFYSQFTRKPFPSKAIDVIVSFMQDAPTDDSNFFAQAFGGAVRKSPRGGTAFPHRDALFYSEPGAGWGTRSEEPGVCDPLTPQAQAWIAEFSLALRPYVDGAYVNVPNVGMQDWETAYWGSNFDRLRTIKAEYDPHNVFKYEQSIPPAS
ncbi:putative FAD-linked oxidoreductase YgaK [Streptomyces nojiriensis]|uniref:FAD-linked oxidoreductase YgaK n=1 Tax=Streptomyces nojiriensis TaxID=66374 RepID=A0ABQ3SXI3_9ACTN|nr:FAD-binding oxidoreductase [Streptomyces nojiriensis]QTI46006.1 putative FAD-linked oxidoreductase YvdP [Streptomyces nojiriensis]GGR88829.1 putative FAD-linked oxidoreductase YgaK [Streptomyces nojiriensis]GHI72480.1 putative FAD-linked oxidoreductase YgaK [Streptomyces nojiriensis]